MDARAPEGVEVEFHVNAHRVRFEPPDMLRIWWCGTVTRADFIAIMELGHRHAGDRPQLVLTDLSNFKGVDADARRLAATDPRNRNVMGIAVVGATFHARVLMMMITKALELFNPDRRDMMHFFDTEAQALAWLVDRRRHLNLGGAG